ncbi:tyrosine-type recombinase/integrase [Paenibacillus sp. FA6]|uniref:tyrosine-type recombinase/integrase n=1 Tax=Paenibacillus sp. FA6 TaxID=3413029 RepID=UPI003F65592F
MASYTKIPANNKQGYKWICTIDGPPDPVTGKRNQIPRRGDTKKEAEQRCQDVSNKLLGHGIDNKKFKKMTFEDVAWDWLKTYSKGNVKDSTVDARTTEIKILLRYFAKVTIDKITHRQYQNFINNLDDEEYSRNTILGVHSTANMIMKHAIKHKMRLDNPCIDVVIPVKMLTVEEIESATIEEGYLEKSELAEFLSATLEHGEPQDVEIFFTLAFSGMRSGELCAWRWPDLSFITNIVRITKTIYSRTNNMRKYKLTPPKTTASIRDFDLDDSIMRRLEKHKKNQAEAKLINKTLFLDYHDNDFVFARKNGYPFFQGNILSKMEKILKKTNIKKRATPHIFRHTHISMLAEAGVDLKTIMKRVGHDDAKTTLKIYTHVSDKMKKSTTEKIKTHFADILNFDF